MSPPQRPGVQQPSEAAIQTLPITNIFGELPHLYILPDTLRNWPYRRIISPHYLEAEAESTIWIESFNLFTPATKKLFTIGKSGLLCGLTFPKASFYDMRSCCEMMHMFFIIEEHSDTSSIEDIKIYGEATMNAILNPDKPRPENEPVVGEVARQFWKRASVHAPPATKERFANAWRLYLDSVIVQASRRNRSRYVCTINEYMAARRDNIGAYPCFAFMEMSLKIDIPHYIMEHPVMVALMRDATDMITLANDMCSYKKEILRDDADYNIVTVVMHNTNTDVAGAMQWISDTHDQLVEHFLMLRGNIFHKINFPSYGEALDSQIEAYVDGLGQWIRGHDEWNFGSGRYFGNQGLEIQHSRVVYIL